MSSTGIVLGFYQNHNAANEAVRTLSRGRFSQSLAYRRRENGRLHTLYNWISIARGALWGLLSGLLLTFFLMPILAMLPRIGRYLPDAPPFHNVLLLSLLFGALWGAGSAWIIQAVWSRTLRKKFAPLIMRGETLVAVQTETWQMERALTTMRDLDNEPPTTFVLRGSDSPSPIGTDTAHTEPLSPERLREQAQVAAGSHRVSLKRGSGKTLLSRLGESQRVLEQTNALITSAAALEQSVSISGEWLLDNSFLLQGQIKDVRGNLPRSYYRELPVLANGQLAGTPRIYGVALDLIAHTDSRLDGVNITEYLNAYQSVSPLTLGELWATPLLLRLALIGQLQRLAEGVAARQLERERADMWANRLRFAVRRDADAPLTLLNELARRQPQISPHFADRLRSQLQDDESALTTVQNWLERRLEAPLSEIVQTEQRRQAADQLSIASTVGSLRALLELDWTEIFEDVSLVHRVLDADAAQVYARMDFKTRDRYRHAIEEIAKWSRKPELEIARLAVGLSQQSAESVGAKHASPAAMADNTTVISNETVSAEPEAPETDNSKLKDLESHVGFYLVDDGRDALEKRVRVQVPFGVAWRRWMMKRATLAYVGGVAFFTALIALIMWRALGNLPTTPRVLVSLLAVLPASDIAVQLVDYLLTRLLPPRPLSRMEFVGGVPDEAKTLVVVPTLLGSLEGIREEVERLEVRFLANGDANINYALLTDYTDADSQNAPDDTTRLEAVSHAIENLNARYGEHFFLFHRERVWSEGEGKWIGWERKRGKLEELNRFLMNSAPENEMDASAAESPLLRVGDAALLSSTRFVITLDADTQLPHDSARHMIEALAHPLNRPHIDTQRNIVTRGYGIIQPRVSTALPSAVSTRFARLYTDARGTDPYTSLVSNTYQDLSGEGAYHGKGIYDLEAFDRVLDHRFPDATLLSHDLIEGAHVRVGLATDIELFDQFPENYFAYAKRQHRWIRGDWQISNWAFGRVPSQNGAVNNPLSGLNKWKIFDNLRRSLVPIAAVTLLILSWLVYPQAAKAASLLIVLSFLVPTLTGVFTYVTTSLFRRALPLRDWIASLGRAVLGLAILPHQAGLNLDAIARVVYRRAVSHQHLLEWTTSTDAARSSRNAEKSFVWRLAFVSLIAGLLAIWMIRQTINAQIMVQAKSTTFAVRNANIEYSMSREFVGAWPAMPAGAARLHNLNFGGAGMASQAPTFVQYSESENNASPINQSNYFDSPAPVSALWWAAPLLLLWAISPFIVRWLSGGRNRTVTQDLTLEERVYLRHLSRQTWRYFDDFIGPQTNWLPPDNYQEYLNVEVAPRTSPTNIGLWLLSALAARDFGYLSFDQVIDRCEATFDTLSQMETHDGHFLNWYDTTTTRPLQPRYVSTVDSGNFLVSLWAWNGGANAALREPVIANSALHGLHDTLAILQRDSLALPLAAKEYIRVLEEFLSPTPNDLPSLIERLRSAGEPAYALTKVIREAGASSSFEPSIYWADALERQIAAWNSVVDRYLLWVIHVAGATEEWLRPLGDVALEARREIVCVAPSLEQIANGEVGALSTLLSRRSSPESVPSHLIEWLDQLAELSSKARWFAAEKRAQAETTIDKSSTLADEMNLRPLYDAKRGLFHIGLNVDAMQLDKSYYDLVASECRLASFAAIANGDVPAEHWLKLRRVFGSNGWRSRPAVLSWSGTMFEYLMPPLLTKMYPNSLLDHACRVAVQRQIEYGHKRGIPWGVSEAAYSALDTNKTYQYHAFGVPGLGLKRGLEDDLVVAPYASCLALMIDPCSSLNNLRRLESFGARGSHGFYESVDFTRARVPEGERGVVVRTFMVHHQGMAFLAFDNVLHGNVMQDRFHSDPRVLAAAPLLYESAPQSPPTLDSRAQDPTPKLQPISVGFVTDDFSTPDTPTPRVNLLSNGEYSIAVSVAGGGYSRWKELDITRWRSDTTRDHWGQFVYVRDADDGVFWSNTHQPVARSDRRYHASFSADRATFRRRDSEIETLTEIIVAPENNAEIRRVTLSNLSKRTRKIEVTSYGEIALASHAGDRAHPAFQKLFVQTEAVPERSALLATRRLRSPKDTPMWMCHSIVVEGEATDFSYETDRARFLGRAHDASNPVALDYPLTNTHGAVLDPVFAIRKSVTLNPGERVQLAFVTGAGNSRERVLDIVERLGDMRAIERAFELAWTNAQIEMQHLRIEPEDAQFFQQLAGHMLFPHESMRASSRRIAQNTLGQPRLWAHGISGDLPILLIQVTNERDIRLVRQALMAHAFWRARGLKTDLVILNDEAIGYEQPLSEALKSVVQSYAQYSSGADQAGGVFVRGAKNIAPEEMTLLLTVARVVLNASRGNLVQQLAAEAEAPAKLPARLVIRQRPPEEPSAPLPFMELPYFNSLGGFTTDGREYATYLGPHDTTPAPWVNVLANPRFGAMISESGPGTTWCDNSQANRLSPWSNDTVSDTPGEAIYIRDEDTGTFWSPTPLPIRELDPYRARHGQGYSVYEHNSHNIEQELVTWVPISETRDESSTRSELQTPTVRIQRLRLRNNSSRRRKISVTFYLEWVLGTTREETGAHIVTSWDSTDRVLVARNAYNPDFPTRVGFVSASPNITSWTGDRTEFLGRNGSHRKPAALSRAGLSGRVGAALDSCGALQVVVEIEPNATQEVVFVLGQAESVEEAKTLSRQYRDAGKVEYSLHATSGWWNEFLERVQVTTPDLGINFLMNRWLMYQTLCCRIWGRTAFYQSGGAYGFRDQLQDVMAVLHAAPSVAREQILRAAQHQFKEGDVQHWWHPPGGAGVRTKFSDDLLWLPYVVSQYVQITGDWSVLDEEVPFIEGKILDENEHEIYMQPQVSAEKATIFEHCRRSIEKGLTSGAHGLPLIGIGDWNDGMSRVGVAGKGESVWLAWFIVDVLNRFAALCEHRGDSEQSSTRLAQAVQLTQAIEENAWDGEWYRRAYFDNGSPLGSHLSDEAKIDSLAQTWSILSGAGNKARSEQAMQSVEKYLVKDEDEMVLLFTPPFDKSAQDPGYIKGYVPGVRENGGQYTHAALWVAQAFARKGDGDRAVEILRMLNPIEHARTPADVELYKVEPYVVAADVYALEGRVGQGGWTWYTGSASWMYRVWLEDVLGVQRRGDVLHIVPNVPRDWNEYSIRYKFGKSQYNILVSNPDGGKTVSRLEVDGANVEVSNGIALVDDGREHEVRVVLG